MKCRTQCGLSFCYLSEFSQPARISGLAGGQPWRPQGCGPSESYRTPVIYNRGCESRRWNCRDSLDWRLFLRPERSRAVACVFAALGCAIILLGATSVGAAPAEYDLIIRSGKVVDGSGNPWFYGDVAVNGDRIVAIGRVAGDATRVMDATGLVVAPGFIDMHSHSDWTLLEDGNAESKIRQGVTTEIIGES